MTPARQRDIAAVLEEACNTQRALVAVTRAYDHVGPELARITAEQLAVRSAQLIDDAIAALGGVPQGEKLYRPRLQSPEALAAEALDRARGK